MEGYSGRIVEWERAHARSATREEAFSECGVPFALLDDVIAYLSDPAPVTVDALPAEKRRRYEAVSSVVLRLVEDPTHVERFNVAVCDPQADAAEVREVWGYIRGVVATDVDPMPDPELDALLRRALDLPREDWDLVHLARLLNLGVYEAKRLETSLKIFEGGAYRVTTKPAPELAKHEAKTPPPKKTEEVREPRQCRSHKAKAVARHPCGAWLCSACLDEDECPTCRKPLHIPKPPTEDREKETPPPPLPPPPPKDEEKPPRRRDEDAQRDFGRL